MGDSDENVQVEYEHSGDHDIKVRSGPTLSDQTKFSCWFRADPMVDGQRQGSERSQGYKG